jgi:hypothetical protein
LIADQKKVNPFQWGICKKMFATHTARRDLSAQEKKKNPAFNTASLSCPIMT